jgi:hypothetical protein
MERLKKCKTCEKIPWLEWHTDPYFDQYTYRCGSSCPSPLSSGIERTDEEAIRTWNRKIEETAVVPYLRVNKEEA